MIVEQTHVEAFLATRFGGDASDVAHLGAGVWSKAFAFRRAGRDYVIRLGAHQEDFAKDRLAARFACPALPIPRVVELGETAGGYFAISERVFGEYIDDVDEAQMRYCPRCSPRSTQPGSPIFRIRPATAPGMPTATRPSPAGEPLCWTSPTIGRRTASTVGVSAWLLRPSASGLSRRLTRASKRSPAPPPRSGT